MAPPTWVSGQVLLASDVNSWFVPLVGYKSSIQSVTSSISLVNDTALLVAMAANATYEFRCYIFYDGANGGDLKWQFTVPASATAVIGQSYLATAGTAITWGEVAAANTTIARGSGSGTVQLAGNFGTATTAATSGNLQLQWAQGTSNATATRVWNGSILVANRIG